MVFEMPIEHAFNFRRKSKTEGPLRVLCLATEVHRIGIIECGTVQDMGRALFKHLFRRL